MFLRSGFLASYAAASLAALTAALLLEGHAQSQPIHPDSGAEPAGFFVTSTEPDRTGAEPILVRVRVGSEQAWEALRSLDAKLYLRGDGFVLVKLYPDELPSLTSSGLPWRQLSVPHPGPLYYLLPGRGSPTLPFPGIYVVGDEREGTIVTGDLQAVSRARSSGYLTIPLDREWPMWRSGFLDLEFVHDAVITDIHVASLVRLISPDTLASYIHRLQNFGTRYSGTSGNARAGRWIVDTLERFGYPDTDYDVIEGPKGELLGNPGNVTGSKPGQTHPEFRVLLGGHYDSITNGGSTPPEVEAPGADDNASGVAAALEVARMLAKVDLDATVEYVFFSEEEQGLIGSRRYATELVLDGVPADRLFFINMDMIGNNDEDQWRVQIFTDKDSKPLADLIGRVAEAYTDVLPVLPGNAGRSDHASFQQVGYPAVFIHEYNFSEVYHSTRDRLSYLEMDYMAEVVRMVMATVLHLANSAEPPTEIVAEADENGDVELDWTHSTDADLIGYQVEVLSEGGAIVDPIFTSDSHCVISHDVLEAGSIARVRSVDVLGAGEPREIFIGTTTHVAARAYPNPVMDAVQFEVFVPGVSTAVDGALSVWDAAGRLVHSVRYQGLGRGSHVLAWDGRTQDGERVPSGVYFYRFEAKGIGDQGGKLLVVQ